LKARRYMYSFLCHSLKWTSFCPLTTYRFDSVTRAPSMSNYVSLQNYAQSTSCLRITSSFRRRSSWQHQPKPRTRPATKASSCRQEGSSWPPSPWTRQIAGRGQAPGQGDQGAAHQGRWRRPGSLIGSRWLGPKSGKGLSVGMASRQWSCRPNPSPVDRGKWPSLAWIVEWLLLCSASL